MPTTKTAAALTIPATREDAIAALVALDVAKWGEGERAASRVMHADKTYGLALNSLAHRPEYDYGDARPDLVKAAKQALTPDDRAKLREGG